MHKTLSTFLIFLFSFVSVLAQQISLEDIVSKKTFREKTIEGLQSSNDGISYTVLENNNTIVRYSYKTGQNLAVLLNSQNLKNDTLRYIEDYSLSPDESQVLLVTNKKPVYRNSFTAIYYVYNFVTKELKRLSKGQQEVASFSPDGERVAFVRDNNLFIKSLRFGTERQITNDGIKDKIINGVPDWVYQEEFEFIKAYEWSPDSKQLAFIKFNEEKVPSYSMMIYKGIAPELKNNKIYPAEKTIKYPKAGEKNSTVSVCVYDLKSSQTLTMDTGKDSDIYIPRIRWSYSGKNLGILKMNRLQNRLDLLFSNPYTGDSRLIYTEKNKRYIETDFFDNLQFLPDDKSFVILSEQNGYKHLYLYDLTGVKIRQLTEGKFDVMKFYGFDPITKMFYYQAAAVSPMQREVYGISLDRKKLISFSDKKGTNEAEFSSGFQFFINKYSSTDTPSFYTINDNKGKELRVLEDNKELKNRIVASHLSRKEFFTFKTSNGVELNGWIIKPIGFNENNRYPVLMMQYSGPNSQEVLDNFGIGWEHYLAQKGYLVVCIDPRGTGARGEEFRKCTYGNLGEFESEDQIEAAKYLARQTYVDPKGIAIWGWSYGGFISSLCMGRGGDVFKAGIAVAPVTNFRFYDSVYAERYLGLVGQNPEGYDNNSPIKMAQNIMGKLLLVHGSADDNVHLQNTMEFGEAMVQAGIPFQEMIYTNRNHSISGGKTRLHLYTLFDQFLQENLMNRK
jgi:dipeptidyl-peptidase-4